MSRYALAIFTPCSEIFSGSLMTSEIFSFKVRATVTTHTRANPRALRSRSSRGIDIIDQYDVAIQYSGWIAHHKSAAHVLAPAMASQANLASGLAAVGDRALERRIGALAEQGTGSQLQCHLTLRVPSLRNPLLSDPSKREPARLHRKPCSMTPAGASARSNRFHKREIGKL
jgi:hypothetical protein